MRSVELLVVGAGPAGISLAVEARHAGVSADGVLVVEKAHAHSWAIRTLYPETKVVTANYKGIDAECEGVLCLADTSKGDTLTYLDRAIVDNDVRVLYEAEVFGIDVRPGDEGFFVRTSKGEYAARVVVIAIGIFGRPNKPDYPLPRTLKDRILFEVTSVTMREEELLIVGGGDSASEYSQYLAGHGNRVTLSYRRADFSRMLDINRESLLALEARGAVSVLRSSNIDEVIDQAGRPHVRFAAPHDARTFDRVVYALGGSTPHSFLKGIGVHFLGDEPHIGDGYETSIPGLFLSGDLIAGRKGGSIIAAFNSSHRVMREICDRYLGCRVVERGEQGESGA